MSLLSNIRREIVGGLIALALVSVLTGHEFVAVFWFAAAVGARLGIPDDARITIPAGPAA